jgi:hypothetical protein
LVFLPNKEKSFPSNLIKKDRKKLFCIKQFKTSSKLSQLLSPKRVLEGKHIVQKAKKKKLFLEASTKPGAVPVLLFW